MNTGESMEMNPRKEEVDDFLGELDMILSMLLKKQQTSKRDINRAEEVYQEEECKIEEYYGQFYEIIDEHKRRVLKELNDEYETSIQETRQHVDLL